MGGRGASSGSSRQGGSVSQLASTTPAKLSDSQLDKAISHTDTQMKRASDRLDELSEKTTEARMSPRSGRTERVNKAMSDYNEGSKLFNELRDGKSALENERAKRKRGSQSSARKPFVNSYGEATRRNITNQTYERAQKRLERDVARFLGR